MVMISVLIFFTINRIPGCINRMVCYLFYSYFTRDMHSVSHVKSQHGGAYDFLSFKIYMVKRATLF